MISDFDLVHIHGIDIGFDPDSDEWKKRSSFTVEEISNLLFKSKCPYDRAYDKVPDEFSDEIELRDRIEADLIKKNKKHMISSIASNSFKHNECKPYRDTYMLSRVAINAWYDYIGEPCPERFKPVNRIKQLPAYLDPNNSDYCIELAVAHRVCEAILVKKEGNSSASITSRIKNYINKNYPDTSEAFVKRIMAVCNPKEELPKKN